jgi:hypothetical protein
MTATIQQWACPTCASSFDANEVYDRLQVDCFVCGGALVFLSNNDGYQLVAQDGASDEDGGRGSKLPRKTGERAGGENGTDIVPAWFRERQKGEGEKGRTSNARKHGEPPRLLPLHTHKTTLPTSTHRNLPMRRADCVDEARPCPYVSCRHHLALIVENGNISETFPGTMEDLPLAGPLLPNGNYFGDSDAPPIAEGPHLDMLPATCVLDLVDEHGDLTFLSVAYLLNISRERVRQIETKARVKFEDALHKLGDDL